VAYQKIKEAFIVLTIEEIQEALRDRRLRVVAMACGLSYPTVLAVKEGKSKPSYETIKRLSDYLTGKGDS
jgi:transcriptional regulator with XRE-family HTH domain